MSSFNVSEYISYILINNENTSSGKWQTFIKTTLLPGQKRVIVVASLPTDPSRDVSLKIPYRGMRFIYNSLNVSLWLHNNCWEWEGLSRKRLFLGVGNLDP